jgi:uncharacterized repeat protein (TIGR01451 family)
MMPVFKRFVHRHHRGLLLLLMLALTAQICEGCGASAATNLPDPTPPRAEGLNLTTGLMAQPSTAAIQAPAVLTYLVTLTAIEGRVVNYSDIELVLPPGVEFLEPIQPVFTTAANNCTVVSKNANNLVMTTNGYPCSFSVNIQAKRPGSFTLIAYLLLQETEATFTDSIHTYTTTTIFNASGGIFVTKQFNPAEVKQGESSTMTIALTNDTPIPVTGVSFEDPLPAGMTLLGVTSNTCPGSTVSTANNTLTFRDGRLEANASCQITATVRGDGSGLLTNTTSFINAVEFNYSNQGQASLNVLVPTSTPLPPPPPEEPSGPVCGNLMCEPGETVANCVRDCG